MGDKIPREIEVGVNWSSLLQDSPQLIVDSPISGKEIYLIDHFFSNHETQSLISESEKHGYGFTDYPKHYRGNLRLVAIDSAFTDAVWTRLKDLVPKHVEEDGRNYNVVGLNDHWRLAKYFPGDQFKAHCDASYEDNRSKHKSMFTVNIYMNEDFQGGSTSFIFEDERFDVVPRTGLCLIFRQPPAAQLLHEGKVVTEGVKYLFRTDIMYAPMTNK